MKKTIISLSSLALISSASFGALTITEIGADDPTNNDGANEYVVIHNTGPAVVNLTDYSIDDSAGSDGDLIPGTTSLSSGEFLVLSAGSNQASLETAWGETIPLGAKFVIVDGLDSFNNSSGDTAVLRDSVGGITVTTLSYTSAATEGLAMTGGTSTATPFSTIIAVPEPSSSALLGLGGLATLLRRRR